ncbi:hypothetical protein [Pseudomonas sp. LB3P58]
MNADLQQKWDTLRKELANNQGWFGRKGKGGFGIDDYRLDELIYQVLLPIEAEKKTPYCPLLFESFIPDISQSLDDCLAYRRELYDLCTQGTRRALEYQLFKDTVDIEQEIAILGTNSDQAKREAIFYENSSKKFKAGGGINPSDKLVAGMNEISIGSASVRNYVSAREATKADAIKKRYDATKKYQTRLEFLHEADGSSLNYLQRLDRITPLLLEEIVDAFEKAKALVAGMNYVLDFNKITIPKVTNLGYLDSFVRWFRLVIRKFAIYVQNERIGMLRISLRDQYRDKAVWEQHYKDQRFKLKFDRPTSGPWDDGMTERLMSVGVGLIKYKGSAGYDDFSNVAVPITVTSPLQQVNPEVWQERAITESFPHTTLFTKDLFATRGIPITLQRDDYGAIPLHNISPYGEWIVSVGPPLLGNGPITNWTVSELIPDDIVIEMRTRKAGPRNPQH